MPTRHIALVPESGMNPSDLARVSAALQKQVTRDLAPVWEVSATVDAFPSLEDVPAGYWPVVLTFRDLGGEAGIHVDANGQPYALIEMSPSWSLTASHVCLEMLTDPFGGRTFPGLSPRSDQGDVEFMGGICDACEHPDNAYLVNDVLVSDFCTPTFWERAPSTSERRSFTGAVEASLQVLPGGHLSWYDPATNSWWLRRHADGTLSDIKVGVVDPRRATVREFISGHVPHLESTKMTLEAFEARVGVPRQRAFRASQARAYWLRASVENLQKDDALRAVLGAPRSPRDASSGRQALSALLRMSLRSSAAGEGVSEGRRVPDAPGATDVDDQTIIVDESVFEQDATARASSRGYADRRSSDWSDRPPAARHTREAPPTQSYVRADPRDASAGYGTDALCDPSRADARSRTIPPPLPADAPPPRAESRPPLSTGVSLGPQNESQIAPPAAVTQPYPPPPTEPLVEVRLPPMPTPRVPMPAPPAAARVNSIPPVSMPRGGNQQSAPSFGSPARVFGFGMAAATLVIVGVIFLRTGAIPSATPATGAALHEAPESTALPPVITPPPPAATVASPIATPVPPPAPHALAPAVTAPVSRGPAQPAVRVTRAAPPQEPASAPVRPGVSVTASTTSVAAGAPAMASPHPSASPASIDSLVDDRR